MREFHRILFVSRGDGEDAGGLKQAMSLARNNQAELTALILAPEFPADLAAYRESFEATLTGHLQGAADAARAGIGVSAAELPMHIEMESGGTPAIRIIRRVLRDAHDLVVKDAESLGRRGLRAMDMELLRKCPTPVWLCRPIARHRGQIRVAVAIDPANMAPEGHELSLRLLRLSRELADSCSGALDIVSCWDYEYEAYLRDNAWIKVPDEQLGSVVEQARRGHRAALDALITESGIGGERHVHHVRGSPEQLIPAHVEQHEVDILVMGTVARTGIHSFVIGNTAENILQRLSCSLLALKPAGFVSPVKAS